MRIKKSIILLTVLTIIMLTSCSQAKELEVSKEKNLSIWKKNAGDGYSKHVFIEKNPIPDEVDVIWNYKKYENWSSLSIHRGIQSIGGGDTTVDYLEPFDEEDSPFYLVVSKDGIELQTNSVYEVESFFAEFGGELN
ncbi:hypothetical protein [Pontibacillus marinus]|uniref:Lipoprotein n=1 Tax=Pontibacillus marinus BH030004 = DSM 16465 TaxID=1385511 RepID=A0A0A5G6K9_9BACI|nr:hypothetical protein [Pontibacillus marinus]KGX87674.1 hypothetical protein N783_09660 [Pontibacillus marinus BH030004 = DSM 16465]